MLGTMGKQFGRQMGQIRGCMCEVRDPDSKHHAPGFDDLAILKLENKAVRGTFDANDEFFFKFRYHSLSEGKPILGEGLAAHGEPRVGIVDPLLSTKMS